MVLQQVIQGVAEMAFAGFHWSATPVDSVVLKLSLFCLYAPAADCNVMTIYVCWL